MKIVIVAPYFYPHLGGAEVYTINIARRLRMLGCEVSIVTTGGRDSDQIETIEGMRVHKVHATMTLSNTPVGAGWSRQLSEIFRYEQPDVINAHTPVPFLADIAQRASGSTPFVLTYHNDLAKDFPPFRLAAWAAHKLLIDRTIRLSTRIIATSEYYALESPHLRQYRAKIGIVPPGVDTEIFRPDVTVEADVGRRYAGSKIILFVGSMKRSHQHKGLGILIQAFANLVHNFDDTKLVAVGEGDAISKYRDIARRLKVDDRIEFTGRLDDHKLAQLYKLATVLAMPSTNRSEGFGMVSMEAAAAGTPVVGSNIGGVPYAVSNNITGLLAEPKSVGSLCCALSRVLKDEHLARSLGQAGAERARRDFSWPSLAAQTFQIFSDVANSG